MHLELCGVARKDWLRTLDGKDLQRFWKIEEKTETTEDAECEDEKNEFFFLQGLSKEDRNTCYSRFYEATSNASVATSICAVCARDRWTVLDGITEIPLTAIPNVHRLIPCRIHPKHDLFDGKLLHRAGVRVVEDAVYVTRHSLANNLWIGDVPWVLKTLTFPEQLLIALAYARVYVFKLFRFGSARYCFNGGRKFDATSACNFGFSYHCFVYRSRTASKEMGLCHLPCSSAGSLQRVVVVEREQPKILWKHGH